MEEINNSEKIEKITKEIFKIFNESGLNLNDIYFILLGYTSAVKDHINTINEINNIKGEE